MARLKLKDSLACRCLLVAEVERVADELSQAHLTQGAIE